jgi:hypothetical protein
MRRVSAAWVLVAPGVPTLTRAGLLRAASNSAVRSAWGDAAGTTRADGTWVITPTGAKSSRV